MSLPIPTEAIEQGNLVQYLRMRNMSHFRVPNETYTKSFKQKLANKALGVSPGVPDIFVIVGTQLIAIEMKRISGSRTTPQQIEWIKRLNDVGVTARICKGCDEAIKFINEIERVQKSESH